MAQVRRTTQVQRLFGQFELARIQLTKAENTLDSAKERARIAKRKRKEAKVAARLAKKAVKRAKEELSEAREAVAITEAKLAQAGKQQTRKKAPTPSGKQAKTTGLRARTARSPDKRQPFRRRASVLARGEEVSPTGKPTQPLSSTPAPAISQSIGPTTAESPGL